MKILVVSDTHKKHDNLEAVIEQEKPDCLYHLGDSEGYDFYIETHCGCPLSIVAGNCDFAAGLPEELLLEVGQSRILLTHGHYYNVNSDNRMLVKAAQAQGADVVLYGHTHCPELTEEEGITILNPGSISYPRQRNRIPTYALITVDANGQLDFSLHEYSDFRKKEKSC
jgi:hypothetical protein